MWFECGLFNCPFLPLGANILKQCDWNYGNVFSGPWMKTRGGLMIGKLENPWSTPGFLFTVLKLWMRPYIKCYCLTENKPKAATPVNSKRTDGISCSCSSVSARVLFSLVPCHTFMAPRTSGKNRSIVNVIYIYIYEHLLWGMVNMWMRDYVIQLYPSMNFNNILAVKTPAFS